MGGTALRIVHGLQRFSEDLDFALRLSDPKFLWKPYLREIEEEFKAYDISLTIQDRSELPQTVKKAFLKNNSFGQLFSLRYERKKSDSHTLRVRLEIDTSPPEFARCESKIVDFPIPYSVVGHDLETLFAGKLNALLTRSFVKGRDWFDFLWYVIRKIHVNYDYLGSALKQFGHDFPSSKDQQKEELFKQLRGKVKTIDWQQACEDVRPLLRVTAVQSLDLWSQEFFLSYIEKMEAS